MKDNHGLRQWVSLWCFILLLALAVPVMAGPAEASECQQLASLKQRPPGSQIPLSEYASMAITICTRQIESNPNDLESVFWRGVAYYKTGLLNNDAYLSALEDFGRVLAARPDDIDALENRAEVYLKIKYYNEAIADATRVIAIDNKSVASYMTRGIARHFTGLTQGAIEDFSKVIEFKPANKGTLRTAYFHRALIYERLGNTAVALADYKSYVAVEPNVAYPYQSLAEYYAKLGQKKEAIETWQTYIAVVERHPRYAQDDYMQKNVAKAREAIQKLSQ